MALTDEQEAALKAEHEKSSASTKAEMDKLKADLAAANKKPDPADPDDLAQKAEKDRLAKDKENSDFKKIEGAVKFSSDSAAWLKTNSNLLPKSIEGIFQQAEKETYSNAIEKEAAIKVGIIQEFFALQANLDLLTPGLKSQVEEFLKMTKTVKQERAQQIYVNVFEPAFEILKRVSKANQLNRDQRDVSDADKALAERMRKLSRKHYLGEKQNA